MTSFFPRILIRGARPVNSFRTCFYGMPLRALESVLLLYGAGRARTPIRRKAASRKSNVPPGSLRR
eukprot:6206712-Pleurochrysis_carterae.AAC.3